VVFEEITYLGYPFSISETFQMRNTNATIEQSVDRVKRIQEICVTNNKEMVLYISMGYLIPANPNLEIGAHFHTTPTTWSDKVMSAYENGCRRFDGVIKGYGGCPMAQDSLVGNMPSENLIEFALNKEQGINLNLDAYQEAMIVAEKIMNHN